MATRTLIRKLARLSRRSHFPEVVAAILATTAGGIGISMLANPAAYERPTTFAAAMDFASPQAWGIAYLVTGLMLGGAVLVHRAVAMWPAIVLTGLWGVWSALMVRGATDGGVPSAAIAYGALCWLTVAIVAVYWTDAWEDQS